MSRKRFSLSLNILLFCLFVTWWHRINVPLAADSIEQHDGKQKHLMDQEQAQVEPSSTGSSRAFVEQVRVETLDHIYSGKGWDAKPIVMEEPYKILFFTVKKAGCTVWKQLFRRMMGYDDWRTGEAANPKISGLRYLNEYSLDQATSLLNDPDYTRAIFVRDPKARFLSAFLDKAFANDGRHLKNNCFRHKRKPERAVRKVQQTFAAFLNVTKTCVDDHWAPQSQRVDPQFLKTLNFVGHLETAHEDAQRLLRRIGAWEEFGRSGWGRYGNESIFESTSHVLHRTSSSSSSRGSFESNHIRLAQYYTPEMEQEIEERYASDYNTPEFHLPRTKIFFGK
jgi:hypothetical protein